ncbi:ABC transporter substrate-binding protein [Caldimonas tepidiphila]|uniref:ABC transporter substrate-binding protein n=1 Tax=Caldimonas tepidiphila TaxID=2315841 RepID=UPI00196BACE2|nr:ABC transporter substrate binding protein [Caldimonas tepidiphila]
MNPSQQSRRRVHRVLAALAAGCALGGAAAVHAGSRDAAAGRRPWRILHVMSHHSPWRWTDGQLRGFQEAMRDVPAEYRVLQMDAKRRSAARDLERRGEEARALIGSWQPDLVYTSDDEAQQYLTRHYAGQDLPFVFSGVNRDPASHGIAGRRNIAGVLEHEHFVESVRLIQAMVPGVRRIAAVFDDSPHWEPVKRRMQEGLAQLPGVGFSAWDTITSFEDYQRRVLDYPERADAIALVGIFNFRDSQGANVPYQQVLRWTAEHSRLPDFAYWVDRVHFGTLAAFTVSEHEQGLAAGRIARAILLEGRSPGSFPMLPTKRGHAAISLARAERLGLRLRSGLLLSAEVIRGFEWDS